MLVEIERIAVVASGHSCWHSTTEVSICRSGTFLYSRNNISFLSRLTAVNPCDPCLVAEEQLYSLMLPLITIEVTFPCSSSALGRKMSWRIFCSYVIPAVFVFVVTPYTAGDEE